MEPENRKLKQKLYGKTIKMIKYFIIFIVGFIEAFGTTINSKFRQKSNLLFSNITARINLWLWVYVISQIIGNLYNITLILIYIEAYCLGDVLGLVFDKYLEKLAKKKGIHLKKKKRNNKKKK